MSTNFGPFCGQNSIKWLVSFKLAILRIHRTDFLSVGSQLPPRTLNISNQKWCWSHLKHYGLASRGTPMCCSCDHSAWPVQNAVCGMSNKRKQARQSRKHRQHRSVVYQCIAVLLHVNLSNALQSFHLGSEKQTQDVLRRQRTTGLHPAQATPAHGVDL